MTPTHASRFVGDAGHGPLGRWLVVASVAASVVVIAGIGTASFYSARIESDRKLAAVQGACVALAMAEAHRFLDAEQVRRTERALAVEYVASTDESITSLSGIRRTCDAMRHRFEGK